MTGKHVMKRLGLLALGMACCIAALALYGVPVGIPWYRGMFGSVLMVAAVLLLEEAIPWSWR